MVQAELRGIMYTAIKSLAKDLLSEDGNIGNIAASAFAALSVHGELPAGVIAI